VVFLVEDNGYAISVPVEKQTAAAISPRWWARSEPAVEEVDGTDFPLPWRPCGGGWTGAARAWPSPGSAEVIRPIPFAFDDERLYKTQAERAAEAAAIPSSSFPSNWSPRACWTAIALEIIVHRSRNPDPASHRERVARQPPARASALLRLYSDRVDPASSAFSTTAAPGGPARPWSMRST